MDEPTQVTSPTRSDSKRKQSSPPDCYVCKVCGVAGHWIQQCPEHRPRKKKKKAAASSTTPHVFVAGVDPSAADIEEAREMQKIKPPNCFCGITSRLKKVKRSSQGQNSRAIGKYFFFCAKQKSNDTKCQFARPVEDELKPKKERLCTFFKKTGKCKKGDKCVFRHELVANDSVVAAKGNPMAATKSEKKQDATTKPIEKAGNVDKSSSESNARPVEREGNDDKSSSTGSDGDEDDDEQF